MSKFTVALFDLDGTVFDTEAQYSIFWGDVGRRYRPDIPGFDKIIKGTTLRQIYDKYFPDTKLQDHLTQELDEWEKHMKYNFVAGAERFISDIKSHGVRCAVVTSSNQKKMDSVRQAVPQFETSFDKILTAEMFKASKPNPDCYLLGAKTFGAPLSECVVFEDALTGLKAGTSSGIYTIGLATTNPREAIEDKCDAVFDDFTQLSYAKVSELIAGL